VADIFDALTHKRPYKRPWSVENSLTELQKMVEQGKLDNDCVTALASSLNAAQHIVTAYCDSQEQANHSG